jgi:hypothetical protein
LVGLNHLTVPFCTVDLLIYEVKRRRGDASLHAAPTIPGFGSFRLARAAPEGRTQCDLEESKIRLRANESGKMRLQKDKIELSAWHCDV